MTRLFSLSAVALFVATAITAFSQDFEKQAADILKLYEQGRTDTAYWLVEPLKRNARFVPAALYVRAQMTPDDRALNLYREVIALDPNGSWADEAAYQLVRRYVSKRDSLAAWTWYGMLTKNFPQSPYVSKALSSLQANTVWAFGGDDSEEQTDYVEVEVESTPNTATGANSRTPAKERTESTSNAASTGTATKVSEDEFSGYALQVGLFPTRAAANRRVGELHDRGLEAIVFEKDVDGSTRYALVVGPYSTKEKAAGDKNRVAAACECGAFTVIVE